MQKVLFISFYYHPDSSPGAIRAKVFCETLLNNEIEPIVLTGNNFSHEDINDIAQDEQVNQVKVVRAKSIDALKLLSIKGKSLGWFALPDRWWPWIFTGWRKANQLSLENDISLVMVTIPANSAAVMSLLVAWKNRLPLVVDLRDPFRFRYDPKNVPAHFLHRFIEKRLIKKAAKVVTTTKECGQYYAELYPDQPRSKFIHIANGFDEESLNIIDNIAEFTPQKFTLLHSGTLYSIGRDPHTLLMAIASLKEREIVTAENFEFIVRGCSAWPDLTNKIKALQLVDLVKFMPMTEYNESLIEMKKASALVVIQGDIFKNQIPSKLYDCLACKVPILVMSKPEYATAQEAKKIGIEAISDTPNEVAKMLESMIKGEGVIVEDVTRESRQQKSHLLVDVLKEVMGNKHGN